MYGPPTDAVAELHASTDKAKEEQSALMEMVNNLTESKVALTTKVHTTYRICFKVDRIMPAVAYKVCSY